MEKRAYSFGLALIMCLQLLPGTALAALGPSPDAQPSVQEVTAPEPEAPALRPVILDRPASEEDPSERILYLEETYDSYSWEVDQGGEWAPFSTEAEVFLPKDWMAGNAFRCTVTRNGQTITSELYADDPDAVPEVPEVNLLWYDDSPHVDPNGVETPEGYTMGKTNYIEYFHSDTWRGDGFDIHGVDQNVTPHLSFQTTYQDAGFLTYAAAENADPIEEIRIPYWGNESTNGAYKDIWTPFGQSLSAQVKLELSPEAYGGRYVKVIYRVKNEGSTPQNFRIGSHGDVMIGENDCAKIWREGKTLVMDGQTRNIYRFNMVAPTCFSTWFGYYRRARENMFKQLLIKDKVAIYDDSGMAWSWKYETIEPGTTWERYVLIGAGDLPEPAADPEIGLSLESAEPGSEVKVTVPDVPDGSTLYLDIMGSEKVYTGPASSIPQETFTVPVDAANNDKLPVSAFVIDKNGGISKVVTQEVTVKWKPKMVLKQGVTPAPIIEDEAGTLPDWDNFVDTEKTVGTVTNNADEVVKWNTPGTYTVTYTAAQDTGGSSPATHTATLEVTVKAKPAKLEGAIVTGDNGKGPFTLKATLTYPGPDNITEAGFVYGPTQNPTVGMAGCKTKTTTSPMATKGQDVSVELKKDTTELVPGLFYYARPYVKIGDSKYIYGSQCSENFYVQAEGFGYFNVEATQAPGQFKITWNGTTGTHTIHYRTVNGSAVGDTHFTHKNGVLTFSASNKEQFVDVAETNLVYKYDANGATHNNVTDFSNANREYFLEIYRPMGGAKILDATQKEVLSARAKRTMSLDPKLEVPREYYTDFQTAKIAAGGGSLTPTLWTSVPNNGDGHDITKITNWGPATPGWSGLQQDFTYTGTASGRADEWRKDYYMKVASEVQFKLSMASAEEIDDGYQYVKFFNDTSSLVAGFEILPHNIGGPYTNCILPFNTSTGSDNMVKTFRSSTTGTEFGVNTNGSGAPYFTYVAANNQPYPSSGISLNVSSSGGGDNNWKASGVTLLLRPGDYTEPKALSIAPMAAGDYLPGDQVTVSVVFNEIVDEINSPNLGDVKLTTNWGEFTYAGGANTNVLYFTGTVPEGKEGSTLEIKSITNLGYIKDMSPDCTSTATGLTNTPTNASVPSTKLHVSDITKSAGGKLSATLTGVDLMPSGGQLEYIWSDSALTPTVGWQTVAVGGEMATKQTEGKWYLYVRVVNANHVVAASAQKAIDLGTAPKPGEGGSETKPPVVLPELKLGTVDNNGWAKSRTIAITKTGVANDHPVTVTLPDGTSAECTTGTYDALQNGLYTFEMTVDGESYTAMATVSKVDTVEPTASITAVPGHSAEKQYGQPVTLTVKADGTGSAVTLTGNWVNGGGSQTATFIKGSNGTYTTTSPDTNGQWKLTVTAKDEAKNAVTVTDSNTYHINSNQPSISLTPLEDLKNTAGTVIGKQWSYTITTNDATITLVQLSGDGELKPDKVNTNTGTVKMTAPGTCYLIVTDKVGHVVKSEGMVIDEPAPDQPALDGTPPKVSLATKESEHKLTTNWTNQNVTVMVTVTDDGLTNWKQENGAAVQELTVQLYRGKDDTEPEDLTLSRVEKDIVPPAEATPPTAQTTVAASAESDGETGPETRTSVSYEGTFTATENGAFNVKAADPAENVGEGVIEISNIDKTKPTIAYTIPDANSKGWHTANIEIPVTPAVEGGDQKGKSKLVSWAYQLPGSDWVTEDMATKSFTLTENQVYSANTIQIRTTNEAGTTTTITLAEELKLDKDKPTAPTVAYKVGNAAYTPESWAKDDVVFTLTSTSFEQKTTSEVDHYEYSTDGANWTPFTDGSTYTHDTNTDKNGVSYQFRAVNKAGTAGTTSDAVLVKRSKLDQAAVDETMYTAGDLSLNGSKGTDPWYIGNVTVTVTKKNTVGTGGLEAVTKYQLYTDPAHKGDVKTLSGTTIPVETDGQWTLELWTEDEAGNRTTALTAPVKLDKTDPTISAPEGNPTEWKNTAQTITFTAADATSGVKTVEVTCGDGKTVEHTDGSFTADRNGTYTITVTDKAGRITTKDVAVTKVDLVKPVITSITPAVAEGVWYGATEFTVDTSDPISGIQSIVVNGGQLKDKNITTGSKFTAVEDVAKSYTYTVTVKDNAGNTETKSVNVQIDTRIDDFITQMGGITQDSTFPELAEVKDWYDSQSKLVQDHIQANPDAKAKYEALVGWIDAKGEGALSDLNQKIKDADTIEEIRTAEKIYNSLPETVQKQVTAGDKSALDKKVADAHRAQQVLDALEAAKTPATTSHQSQKGTVQAYENLTEEQKALIPPAKKSVCETIKANVKAVDNALRALEAAQQKPLTPEKIAAAEEAYNALSDDQKSLFPADAGTRLEAAKNANASAGTVGTTISGLGDAPSEADILSAKKAYDALSEVEKQLVSAEDKAKLDAAYHKLIDSKEAAEKKAIQDALNFTAKVKEAEKDPTVEHITALENTCNKLSAEAKAKLDDTITNGAGGTGIYDNLIKDRDAAKAVIDQLNSVTPENLNSTEGTAATGAYAGLSDEQKKLVDQATQNKNQDIVKSREAIDKISKIPDPAPTPDSDEYDGYKAKVDAAKQAYDMLPDSGRKLVGTDEAAKLNAAYDAMIKTLEFRNRDTTSTTDVEISGLTQVPVPPDAATAPKTVVKVEAEDSVTPFAPKRPNKDTVMSVDVTLVAYLEDQDGNEISRSEIQPSVGKPVTVKLRLPGGYRLDTLEVWHVLDNGLSILIPGSNMTLVTEADGLYAVFSVDHFSHFVFFAEQIPPSGGSGGNPVYPPRQEKSEHGSVTVSPSYPGFMDQVTITPKPEKGYVVDTITVTDRSGNKLPVKKQPDGTYTFTQPMGKVTIQATFRRDDALPTPDETGVSDLLNTKDHAAYMQGYRDGRFGPKDDLTRAQAAQLFYNLLLDQDVPTDAAFEDVRPKAWYAKAVNTMAALGIMGGVGGNRFAPGRPITRAEFTATAMRFASLETEGAIRFSDVSEKAWYADAVSKATAFGWINGYPDGTFQPKGTIARAEVAAMVNRMLGRSPDRDWIDSHSQELAQFPDVTHNWAYYPIMEAANSHTHRMEEGTEHWTGLQK